MSNALQDLVDREEIRQLRARFAWALDSRDWLLFASLFTDELEVDLAALGLAQGPTSRAALVERFRHAFRRPPEEMGTQQLYGNVFVDLTGDTATVRSYLLGHHHIPGFAGGAEVALRAAYLDRVVRTDDGWKICASSLQVFSLVGNAAIFA